MIHSHSLFKRVCERERERKPVCLLVSHQAKTDVNPSKIYRYFLEWITQETDNTLH